MGQTKSRTALDLFFFSINMKVLAAGTFDMFHPGHQFFLDQAKMLGDELFVIIARDDSVKKIKGFFPEHSEVQRKTSVKNFLGDDTVFLGDHHDFLKIPKQIQPDIIALGYDQMIPKLLRESFPHVSIVRIPSFSPEQYKSSLLRAAI